MRWRRPPSRVGTHVAHARLPLPVMRSVALAVPSSSPRRRSTRRPTPPAMRWRPGSGWTVNPTRSPPGGPENSRFGGVQRRRSAPRCRSWHAWPGGRARAGPAHSLAPRIRGVSMVVRHAPDGAGRNPWHATMSRPAPSGGIACDHGDAPDPRRGGMAGAARARPAGDPAKVDTGARTSALARLRIEVSGPPGASRRVHRPPDPGPPTHRDQLLGRRRRPARGDELATASATALRHRHAVAHGRPSWPIELTLTNREAMRLPHAARPAGDRARHAIDPSASFRQPRLSFRLYSGQAWRAPSRAAQPCASRSSPAGPRARQPAPRCRRRPRAVMP